MIVVTGSEAMQLVVGSITGFALSINMSRCGLSVLDPETRWKSLALVGSYLFAFLALTDWIASLGVL